MSNRLINETSPYLLQHAENPVDWYAWCDEAFAAAREQDKPIFLSIGYSTCHWCHVMAHESFEDAEIAELLNKNFISIKVDKEERPDIDSIYMSVCQAFSGSGGWPTSIFMTPQQKPFFAGTYFPRAAQGGMIGMRELLQFISDKWQSDRKTLLSQAEKIVSALSGEGLSSAPVTAALADSAAEMLYRSFDHEHGGFGRAPKFPTPHNLVFLMDYYERYSDSDCLKMALQTLKSMYRGGMFDHIGGGFCRYSTDRKFLVPHFEKMLYDNALLISAYCRAYSATGNRLFLSVAERTAGYVLREMTAEDGGFYSAQDADSEGEEGKFYTFTPDEVISVLGQRDGAEFCRHFGITEGGNFEGKSILSLFRSDENRDFSGQLAKLYEYRKNRHSLHLDDKFLCAWNSLMIKALCQLYTVSGEKNYLTAAQKAEFYLMQHLCDGDRLFVSYRAGRRGERGFLDDYAAFISAQLALYRATAENRYLDSAKRFCAVASSEFSDKSGGFYLYGENSETLILRPKETYDGAMPSGNSLMAQNLVRLWHLTDDEEYRTAAERQLEFMSAQAADYPAGHCAFLSALLEYLSPPEKITVVQDGGDMSETALTLPLTADVVFLHSPTKEYPLKDGKTTFYVCKNRTCRPPVNEIKGARLP